MILLIVVDPLGKVFAFACEVAQHLVNSNNIPTGYGKSLCYACLPGTFFDKLLML